MDAYDDLEKDRKKERFNALQALAGQLSPAEYEARVEDIFRAPKMEYTKGLIAAIPTRDRKLI